MKSSDEKEITFSKTISGFLEKPSSYFQFTTFREMFYLYSYLFLASSIIKASYLGVYALYITWVK